MPSHARYMQATAPWSIARARQVYNLANWAEGYFDIDSHGHLVANSKGSSGHPGVSLYALAATLKN
ncbi:MAG TPA: hypothetical protein VKB96_04220, partial [Gammaproteobacteria bacterium]|nr:hypothetical protein [Gammaproteobacteria bacterium]